MRSGRESAGTGCIHSRHMPVQAKDGVLSGFLGNSEVVIRRGGGQRTVRACGEVLRATSSYLSLRYGKFQRPCITALALAAGTA